MMATEKEKRTDVHRPSVIQPEDYEYVGVEHQKLQGIEDIYIIKSEREKIRRHMERTGGTYSGHKHGGSCHICGAWCIYTALFHHIPTNTYIRTGFDCAEKMLICDESYFRTFRKACQEALKMRKGKVKAEQILINENLEQAWEIYSTDHTKYCQQVQNSVFTIKDIVGKLVQYGCLSEKQINFLRTLVDRINKWPEIQAQREKERESAEDCPEGRIEIVGVIISIKEKISDFGNRWVMTVKDDRGFVVWGTLPRIFMGDLSIDKGRKVKFTATITPSDNDSKFGFFKRPTKGEVL